MTARTWIGGGGNYANDARDWSLSGVPAYGDTLTMRAGSMVVSGNALAGDMLNLGPSYGYPTAPIFLALQPGALLSTMSASAGPTTVYLPAGYATLGMRDAYAGNNNTVYLGARTTLFANFTLQSGSLTVIGAPGSVMVTTGTSTLPGTQAVIDTDIVGAGTIAVGVYSHRGGAAELGGTVWGEKFIVAGNADRVADSTLQIDRPAAFGGSLELGSWGRVSLMGLANADAYSFRNDMLSVYSHGKAIDTMHLHLDPASSGALPTLRVTATSNVVMLDTTSGPSLLGFHGLRLQGQS